MTWHKNLTIYYMDMFIIPLIFIVGSIKIYNFTKQTLSSFTQYENHHFSSNFNYLQCCIFCTTASRWIIYDKWRHGNGNDSNQI